MDEVIVSPVIDSGAGKEQNDPDEEARIGKPGDRVGGAEIPQPVTVQESVHRIEKGGGQNDAGRHLLTGGAQTQGKDDAPVEVMPHPQGEEEPHG